MTIVTTDAPHRATRAERFVFEQVRRAEAEYARKLRRLAQFVMQTAQEMMTSTTPPTEEVFISFAHLMDGYSNVIKPWAERVALKMIHDVALRDMKAWRERAKEVSWNLEALVRETPLGLLMQQRMEDQVGLITSIPRDIAQEVHQMAIATLYSGQRYGSIRDMIMQKSNASLARANLIARTEVARTTTELTRARSDYVGSDSYVWRSVQDSDVRPLHKKLDGHVFRWDDPPVADERTGIRAHPGSIWNCRCVPEVIVPGFEPERTSWKPSKADQARWDAPVAALVAAEVARKQRRRGHV